jgi:putative ABC transport system permease protein
MAHVQAQRCNGSKGLILNHLNFIIMFKHLLKLIWNKKKQNSLLIIEVLVSFLALFGIFSFAVNSYLNYAKPMGIDYENIWAINYNNSLKTNNGDSLALFYQSLVRSIKAMPEVKDAAITTGNIPFSNTHMSGAFTYKGEEITQVNQFLVDEHYLTTLNAKMKSGRWYTKQDLLSKENMTIINASLKTRVFGNEDAIGKLIDYHGGKCKIIGVLEDIKFNGDYQKADLAAYDRIDTGSYNRLSSILVKVSPDAGAASEGKIYKLMANSLKNSNIEVEHLSNKLESYNKFTLIPLIILSIVAGFLIINVAMGLFGVLWYNINKRRGEIGLRRAIGATGNAVSTQLVQEALILATFSLIIGSFFAIQFPLLNVFNLPAAVYLTALALSIVFIYLLVLVCSLYPGRQAAAIYPAVALHEE